MKLGNKKTLLMVVYYTLIALVVINGGCFVYTLVMNDLEMWAKAIYFVWIAAMFGCVLFDIILLNNKEQKYLTGWIVYILSLLSLAMLAIIAIVRLGFTNLTNVELITSSVALIPVVISGFLIPMWFAGEKLNKSERTTTQISENK